MTPIVTAETNEDCGVPWSWKNFNEQKPELYGYTEDILLYCDMVGFDKEPSSSWLQRYSNNLVKVRQQLQSWFKVMLTVCWKWETNSGLLGWCFADPSIHHPTFSFCKLCRSIIMSNVKMTTDGRGLCLLNVSVCCFRALAKTTDSVIFSWDRHLGLLLSAFMDSADSNKTSSLSFFSALLPIRRHLGREERRRFKGWMVIEVCYAIVRSYNLQSVALVFQSIDEEIAKIYHENDLKTFSPPPPPKWAEIHFTLGKKRKTSRRTAPRL